MSEEDEVKDRGSGPSLEGVNKTAVAVIVLLVGVGALALAYFFNLVSDQIIGMLIAAAFTAVLGFLVLRVALDQKSSMLRSALIVFILGCAAVALYPAKVALHLGHPDASATLNETSKTLSLPSGGAYSVLVSGHLGEGRDAKISYRLKSGDEIVDGALERQYMTRRARRGAAIQVPEDHDLEVYEMTVPASGAPSIVLETVTGQSQLLVQAYAIIPPWIVWICMVVLALFGTYLEAKMPCNGTIVMAGVAAVCFGIIIKTANPTSMAWATLWGSLLAAGGGALGGSILGAIGKRFVAAPDSGPKKARDRKGKAEKDDKD